MIIQLVVIVLFSLNYLFMGKDHFKFINDKQNYIDYLYFSTITSSTLGYGDIVPFSDAAKIIVMFQIIITYSHIIQFLMLKDIY